MFGCAGTPSERAARCAAGHLFFPSSSQPITNRPPSPPPLIITIFFSFQKPKRSGSPFGRCGAFWLDSLPLLLTHKPWETINNNDRFESSAGPPPLRASDFLFRPARIRSTYWTGPGNDTVASMRFIVDLIRDYTLWARVQSTTYS